MAPAVANLSAIVDSAARLGTKAGEPDPIFCQKHRIPTELTNIALERAGHSSRVDHRSLEAQGVQRIPGSHMGPAVAGMARRGAPSHIATRVAAQVAERLERARVAGELERQMARIEQGIIDTSCDLLTATRARDAMAAAKTAARSGVDAFRAQAEARQVNAKREQRALDAIKKLKTEQALQVLAEQQRNAASAKELERQRQVAHELLKAKHDRSRPGPSR